jgi:hypothetical protein
VLAHRPEKICTLGGYQKSQNIQEMVDHPQYGRYPPKLWAYTQKIGDFSTKNYFLWAWLRCYPSIDANYYS